MSFRITGLSPAPFQPLFGLSDAALAAQGVIRTIADTPFSFPDRIALRDAEVGESLLLLNHAYQPAETPYYGRHAIFVREGATQAATVVGTVPDMLRRRLLSLRAFDRDHLMIEAEVCDGSAAEAQIAQFFENAQVAYLQAHSARRGCFLAQIDRL